MALPEPTIVETLEKKIPSRYANNELVIDFLKVRFIEISTNPIINNAFSFFMKFFAIRYCIV